MENENEFNDARNIKLSMMKFQLTAFIDMLEKCASIVVKYFIGG